MNTCCEIVSNISQVIEWKDPDRYRPATTCQVVVITAGQVCTMWYSKKYEKFNCSDSYNPDETGKYDMSDHVQCWEYLHCFL